MTTSGSPSGHFGAGLAASGSGSWPSPRGAPASIQLTIVFTCASDRRMSSVHIEPWRSEWYGGMRLVRSTSRIIGAKPLHDLVAVHRERPDAALRVAGHALVGEDRRDLRRVGDLRELRRPCWRSGNSTGVPFTAASATGDWLAVEHGVERCGEARLLVLLLRERVVDRAVIGDRPGLRFRRRTLRRSSSRRAHGRPAAVRPPAPAGRPSRACRRTCRAANSATSRASGTATFLPLNASRTLARAAAARAETASPSAADTSTMAGLAL